MARIQILSKKEQKELFGVPNLNEEQRLFYFKLSSSIEEELVNFYDDSNKMLFILLLGYFRVSHIFFKLDDFSKSDILYVKNLYHLNFDENNLVSAFRTEQRYRTLIVKDSSSFKTGDRIVILDGEKTEFNRIISVTGNKLVLKNRLLYTHSKNIEVRVLEYTDKLNVKLQKDVLAGQNKILLAGGNVSQINSGDILVLKENEKEETLLAVSTGLERDTVEMEDFISFGGIVTNSSEKPSPVIGAKVISMDENDRVLDFTFTDINGRFLFEKIPGKTKKLKIQRQGYKEKTVDIERFDIENLSIKLQPID